MVFGRTVDFILHACIARTTKCEYQLVVLSRQGAFPLEHDGDIFSSTLRHLCLRLRNLSGLRSQMMTSLPKLLLMLVDLNRRCDLGYRLCLCQFLTSEADEIGPSGVRRTGSVVGVGFSGCCS